VAKIGNPSGEALAGARSQNLWLCFFVAPCQPPARASRTHFLFVRWVLDKMTAFRQTLSNNQRLRSNLKQQSGPIAFR
jgi:hypothetical protein